MDEAGRQRFDAAVARSMRMAGSAVSSPIRVIGNAAGLADDVRAAARGRGWTRRTAARSRRRRRCGRHRVAPGSPRTSAARPRWIGSACSVDAARRSRSPRQSAGRHPPGRRSGPCRRVAARVRPSSAPIRARGSGRRWRRTHSASPASSGRPAPLPPVALAAATQGRPPPRRSCRDVERVARPAAAPRQDLARAYTLRSPSRRRSAARATRDVAADQRDARWPRHLDEPVEQAIDVRDGKVRREHQRQQRIPRAPRPSRRCR